MSFSTQVKRQIASLSAADRDNGPRADCCLWAETCGLLLFSPLLSSGKAELRTDSSETARYIAERLSGQLGVYVDMIAPGEKPGREKIYTVRIPEERQRKMAGDELLSYARQYGYDGAEGTGSVGEFIAGELSRRECCRSAFVRGAFLAAGTVAEPEKSYCLEICVPDEGMSRKLAALLSEAEVKCGVTTRHGKRYVYIHDSEGIETVLAMTGAGSALFDLLNLKILREQRNIANRRRNCDDANTSKTVNAAWLQLDAIKKIEKTAGLVSLPPELREIAKLRLENPHVSLRELGELMEEPLSRSGVNHRLRRIMEIAEGISDADARAGDANARPEDADARIRTQKRN